MCIRPLVWKQRRYDDEVPEGLYYTKEHEWMRVEGDTVTIGITDHAQDMLTDIVYIELPEEGDVVGDMGEFAVVESVKSASPILPRSQEPSRPSTWTLKTLQNS